MLGKNLRKRNLLMDEVSQNVDKESCTDFLRQPCVQNKRTAFDGHVRWFEKLGMRPGSTNIARPFSNVLTGRPECEVRITLCGDIRADMLWSLQFAIMGEYFSFRAREIALTNDGN